MIRFWTPGAAAVPASLATLLNLDTAAENRRVVEGLLSAALPPAAIPTPGPVALAQHGKKARPSGDSVGAPGQLIQHRLLAAGDELRQVDVRHS